MSKKLFELFDHLDFTPTCALLKENKGVSAENLKTERAACGYLRDLFDSGGRVSPTSLGQDISIQDIVTSTKYNPLFRRVIESNILEIIQPQTVISDNLFKTINVEGEVVNKITVFGALEAQPIAEGTVAANKEPDFSNQGYQILFDYIRYGLSIGLTEEAIKKDTWGLLKYYLWEGANALARTREKAAFKLVDQMGTTLFNNFDANSAQFGRCTGRGINGNANGTFSFNDFMDAYTFFEMREFNCDTILVHPFIWRMWMTNPELKEVVINGGKIISNKKPSGSPFPGWDTYFNGFGYRSAGNVNPFVYELQEFGATFQTKPDALPGGPLTIIVTPRAGFARATITEGETSWGIKGYSNIIFADSNRAGVKSIAEYPNIRNWDEIAKRATFWEISEKYAMAILEQGKGIGIARNVVCDREYNFTNVNSVALNPINPFTNFTATP